MTGRVQGHCCIKAGLANSVEHSLPFLGKFPTINKSSCNMLQCQLKGATNASVILYFYQMISLILWVGVRFCTFWEAFILPKTLPKSENFGHCLVSTSLPLQALQKTPNITTSWSWGFDKILLASMKPQKLWFRNHQLSYDFAGFMAPPCLGRAMLSGVACVMVLCSIPHTQDGAMRWCAGAWAVNMANQWSHF